MRIDVPRDRAGTFAPVLVPKHARHLSGFDEAVISLYAKGMTTGDIVNHLADVYGASVSKELVSRVTDAVVEQMQAWQSRPLDAVYPVILVDCIHVKVREGQVTNRPFYVVMGITVDGERDVLGLWAGPAGAGEGARAWVHANVVFASQTFAPVLGWRRAVGPRCCSCLLAAARSCRQGVVLLRRRSCRAFRDHRRPYGRAALLRRLGRVRRDWPSDHQSWRQWDGRVLPGGKQMYLESVGSLLRYLPTHSSAMVRP